MAKKKKIKAPKAPAKKKKFQRKVKTVMDEYKAGKLNIGKSDKKVKSRAQAIAISLSEASKAVKKKAKKKKKKPAGKKKKKK